MEENRSNRNDESVNKKVEFDQEPITPKRTVPPKVSFIDKLKSKINKTGGQTSKSQRSGEEPGNGGKGPLNKIPPRFRRLVIAFIILIIAIILFLIFKPSSKTSDSFKEQEGSNLPVEFQSIEDDEEQASGNNQNQMDEDFQTGEDTANKKVNGGDFEDFNVPTGAANPAEKPVNGSNSDDEASHSAHSNEASTRPNEQAVRQHQANKTQVEPKSKAKPKSPSKTNQPTKNTAIKSKAGSNNSTGTSKVLTITKGKSLMQVFRDNNLNISDVNAMTKASGSNNILSSFKAGDKIRVTLNSNKRVTELTVLSNGKKFVRQSNGTYVVK